MYCPRCATKRVSEETSFCSKCGLLLDHIEEVVGNEGSPLIELAETGSWFSARNIRIGALLWFVVVTVLMTPIAAIMKGPKEMIATLAILGPVGAALLLIFSMFFALPEEKGRDRKKVRELKRSGRRKELPPEHTVFAEDLVTPGREPDFTDLRQTPPSVTEETTRHLDRKTRDPDSA